MRGPDFAWNGDFIALGIGNGRQAGGGQALCPDASIDDGLLDLTVVPELSGELGETVGTLLTDGRHAALDRVAVRAQLPWLEIESEQPLTLNLDGEPLESIRFRVDCVAVACACTCRRPARCCGVPGTPQPHAGDVAGPQAPAIVPA